MLSYPSHRFQPEELLHFIELRPFTKAWDDDLKLDDEALAALQIGIMANPKAGAVIPGTGGLRKLRFAPESWPEGKRGAIRVCYVHFEEFGIVLLVIAYSKHRKDDLSSAEKETIRGVIETIGTELRRRETIT